MRDLSEVKFKVKMEQISHPTLERQDLGSGLMCLGDIYKEMDKLGIKELSFGSWVLNPPEKKIGYSGKNGDEVLSVEIYLGSWDMGTLKDLLDIGSRLTEGKEE